MKNYYKNNYTRVLFLLIVYGMASIWLYPEAHAQQEMDDMPASYQDPNKVVSLERSLPFPQAIQILNGFAQQYEKRFIVDKTNTTGAINVSLPPMHWKKAMNYIVDAKGLNTQYTEEAIEIINPQETAGPQQEAGQQQGMPQAASQGGEQVDLPGINAREVQIEATFFEGNKRALKQVGVDWSTLTSGAPTPSEGEGGGQGGEGSQLPANTDEEFVRIDARGAQSVSQNLFSSMINFGEIGAGVSVQALFNAFEQDNLGQILAHPTVKVLEGNEGRIQVGQDFSVKQKTFSGNVTEKFFSVGTILTVTPHIIQRGDSTFIYMTIQAERSSAQPTGESAIINKQVANTNITLLDGESTVIAGLYRTEKSTTREGVPILKDLPPWFLGLRYLFGYNSTDQLVRELVILIEASIEPSIPQRIAKEEKTTMANQLKEVREYHDNLTKPNDSNIGEDKPLRNTILDNTTLDYYIIGGSYENQNKAEDHQSKLKEQGYNSKIVKKENSDLYLVSYFEGTGSKKAKMLLDEIRSSTNKEAWLYKDKVNRE